MEEAEYAYTKLDAKINRLRLLKRKWTKSISRALPRSIETIEDLEELERQEVEELKRRETKSIVAWPTTDPVPEESFPGPS